MIRWRVYYGDGTTLDNTQCSVFELPTQDVQAVVQFDLSVGRIVLNGLSVYCWHDKDTEWKAHDYVGMWDYLFHVQGPKYLLFGKTISNEDFFRIRQEAIADKDFLGGKP